MGAVAADGVGPEGLFPGRVIEPAWSTNVGRHEYVPLQGNAWSSNFSHKISFFLLLFTELPFIPLSNRDHQK